MAETSIGAWSWAQAAADRVDTADVIAVAHSLGGMARPSPRQLLPLRRLVLAAATVPQPGLSYADYLQTDAGRGAVVMPITFAQRGEDVRGECTWPVARHYFYLDCDERVARATWERLTPRAATVFTEPRPSTPGPTCRPRSSCSARTVRQSGLVAAGGRAPRGQA
jgi:hypothetical protein